MVSCNLCMLLDRPWALGSLCTLCGHEQDQADEALPHRQGVPPGPAPHDTREVPGVLPVCKVLCVTSCTCDLGPQGLHVARKLEQKCVV